MPRVGQCMCYTEAFQRVAAGLPKQLKDAVKEPYILPRWYSLGGIKRPYCGSAIK